MWDLQRNGGSVQATTERVLSGRSLDTVREEGLAPDMSLTGVLILSCSIEQLVAWAF